MSEPGQSAERTRVRRRPRFTIRALIVCTLAIGLLLSMTSWSRRQRYLVANVENAGGDVIWEVSHETNSPPGPAWLREIVGDGLFFQPQKVLFRGTITEPMQDDVIESLSRLDSLDELSFSFQTINAEQFRRLMSLRRLKVLDVVAEFLPDESIDEIKALQHLERLGLYGPPIGARGAKAISTLTQLKSLSIPSRYSRVDDEAVRAIASISSLEYLWFNAGHVSDRGLMQLASLKRLKELEMDDCSASDAVIGQLKAAVHGLTIHATPPAPK